MTIDEIVFRALQIEDETDEFAPRVAARLALEEAAKEVEAEAYMTPGVRSDLAARIRAMKERGRS